MTDLWLWHLLVSVVAFVVVCRFGFRLGQASERLERLKVTRDDD